MRLVAGSLVFTALTLGASAAAVARVPAVPFVVDGVHVTIPRTVAPGIVLQGQPGDATQETTIVDRQRQRTISVIAIPYATRAGTDGALPVAHRNGVAAYRNALHDYRAARGQFAIPAPAIRIFGTLIPGDAGVRHDDLVGRTGGRDALTAEWVTEAGSRIWIVRVSEYVGAGATFEAMPEFIASVDPISVWADGSSLATPTTVRKDAGSQASPEPLGTATPGGDAGYLTPPGYSDRCDAAAYDAATNVPNWRNFLGAAFRGVPACGPRPASGGVEVSKALYNGAPVNVQQFSSTELALRWLYLVHRTPPFAGDGDELYGNYDAAAGGDPLTAVPNGGASALPRAGDVISYDTGGTSGHTAVVVGMHLDGNGRGFVDVMEQDASPGGYARLPVIGNTVFSNYGGYVGGWLTPRSR